MEPNTTNDKEWTSGLNPGQKSEHKSYAEASPEEVKRLVKEQVSKGVAAAAGAVEGFADEMEKDHVAETAGKAIEQAGEATRTIAQTSVEQARRTRQAFKGGSGGKSWDDQGQQGGTGAIGGGSGQSGTSGASNAGSSGLGESGSGYGSSSGYSSGGYGASDSEAGETTGASDGLDDGTETLGGTANSSGSQIGAGYDQDEGDKAL